MYASGSRSVDTVIVDGRVILENGSFVALDEERLIARVDEASRSMLARMGATVTPDRSPHGPQSSRKISRM
jgi:hypothetical protein